MFVWGALLYFRIYNPPTNAMNIYVVGKQWMWKAEHPGGQHEINALHIPINRPIQITLISQDVFHSFSIPAFRVKREVIPGRYNTVWFEATEAGHLSPVLHAVLRHDCTRQMIGEVVAMTPEDYEEWAAASTSGIFARAERRAAVCEPGMQFLPQQRAECARTEPGQCVWIAAAAEQRVSRYWWMMRFCGMRF